MASGATKQTRIHAIFTVLVVTSLAMIVAMTFVTQLVGLKPAFYKVLAPLRAMTGRSVKNDVIGNAHYQYAYEQEMGNVTLPIGGAERGINSVRLFKRSGVCNVTKGTTDGAGNEFFSTGSHAMCVAVLTGYPDVARREYLERVLRNLRRDVAAPEPYDLHVFCQGECHVTVCEDFGASAVYHEIEKTVHMEMTAGRQTMRDVLHPMRWYYLSQNYFFMFEQLFVRALRPYRHCVIIEDDLLLAPDALYYARAGMDLMDSDPSVFAVSFSNDNSHIPHARDQGDFRRIDHFSGLGFMISAHAYLTHLRRAWARNKAWDIMVQWMFNRKGGLVSIQPEVMRAFHESDKSVPDMRAVRRKYQRSVIADGVLPRERYSLAGHTEAGYDAYIRSHLRRGTRVEHVTDAAFFTEDTPLVYTGCRDKDGLDAIMSRRHLVGIGLGKVVRGVYKHTVFLRVYYAKLLVVCEDSPFWPDVTPSAPFDPGTLNISLHRHVPRVLLGPIHGLHAYTKVIGELNQSCADACRQRELRCESYGLRLLEEGCDVLYYYYKECLTCKSATGKRKGAWPRPSIDNEQVCHVGPVLTPCDQVARYERRICACK